MVFLIVFLKYTKNSVQFLNKKHIGCTTDFPCWNLGVTQGAFPSLWQEHNGLFQYFSLPIVIRKSSL